MFVSIAEPASDIMEKIVAPRQIEPLQLGFSALSTVVIVLLVLAAVVRVRNRRNPLIETTWLSARNDAIFASIYAAVQFAVGMAPVRAPELALDALSVLLTLQ